MISSILSGISGLLFDFPLFGISGLFDSPFLSPLVFMPSPLALLVLFSANGPLS